MDELSLAEDTRARVPFALIGVILLVGSATYAASLAGPDDPGGRSAVSRSLEEATAATRVALRRAVHRAARDAAAAPVTRAANTTYGRILGENRTFRRSLRLRIAVELRRELALLETEADGVISRVGLPPITDSLAARKAIGQIRIVDVSDGDDRLRVSVSGFNLTAHRGGQEIDREQYTVNVTVGTPVLRLHDRVRRFQRALNASPFETGFPRRLTARLTAVVWARGYAQYAGAPIQNVLANRHIEVAANGALISTQRSVFGQADRLGVRRHRCAALETGVSDLLGPTALTLPEWTSNVLGKRCRAGSGESTPPAPVDPGALDRRRDIPFERVAEDAYVPFVDGSSDASGLDAVVRAATSVRVRLIDREREIESIRLDAPHPTGWTPAGVERTRSVSIESTQAEEMSAPDGWVLGTQISKRVITTTHVTRQWRKNGNTMTTEGYHRETVEVTIGLSGRANRGEAAPGPLVEDRRRAVVKRVLSTARDRLIREQGGIDAIIPRVRNGSLERREALIPLDVPGDTVEQARMTTAKMLDRLRDESVTRRSSTLLNNTPAAHLVSGLERRRSDLLSVDAPHETVRDRARAAAERAYLNRVRSDLEEQSNLASGLLARMADQLRRTDRSGEHLGQSDRLRDLLDAASGPKSTIRVAGVPSYLVRTHVDADTVPALQEAYYPLVTRNVNQATLPWDDTGDAMVGSLTDGDGTVSLDRAARALRAAEHVEAGTNNQSLRNDRRALRNDLRGALRSITRRLTRIIVEQSTLTWAEAQGAVDRTTDAYPTVHDRALAAVNGSLVTTLETVLSNRTSGDDPIRTRLSVRLRSGLRQAAAEARQPQATTDTIVGTTKRLVRAELADRLQAGARRTADRVGDRWTGKALLGVPAGVPVIPFPGAWYMTANTWTLTIRGSYARFAVSAPTGDPLAGSDGRLTYVRGNRSVSLDVDGDGTADRLGRTAPISFEVDTAVAVAVPPGGRGVGDTNGVRNETSPGWNDTAGDLYQPVQSCPCSWRTSATPMRPQPKNSEPSTSDTLRASSRRQASRRSQSRLASKRAG